MRRHNFNPREKCIRVEEFIDVVMELSADEEFHCSVDVIVGGIRYLVDLLLGR